MGSSRLSDAAYSQDRLTDAGQLLYNLMRLDQVPREEQVHWLALLGVS
jgi:hypothetical protein